MIWECASCGHHVVGSKRPAGCRFWGSDVTFYVTRRGVFPGARRRHHPPLHFPRLPAETD